MSHDVEDRVDPTIVAGHFSRFLRFRERSGEPKGIVVGDIFRFSVCF